MGCLVAIIVFIIAVVVSFFSGLLKIALGILFSFYRPVPFILFLIGLASVVVGTIIIYLLT